MRTREEGRAGVDVEVAGDMVSESRLDARMREWEREGRVHAIDHASWPRVRTGVGARRHVVRARCHCCTRLRRHAVHTRHCHCVRSRCHAVHDRHHCCTRSCHHTICALHHCCVRWPVEDEGEGTSWLSGGGRSGPGWATSLLSSGGGVTVTVRPRPRVVGKWEGRVGESIVVVVLSSSPHTLVVVI